MSLLGEATFPLYDALESTPVLRFVSGKDKRNRWIIAALYDSVMSLFWAVYLISDLLPKEKGKEAVVLASPFLLNKEIIVL